jgi:hypothetical protein
MPAKYSPQMPLPPIRSGCVPLKIVPVTARELAWTPLTNSRRFAPS